MWRCKVEGQTSAIPLVRIEWGRGGLFNNLIDIVLINSKRAFPIPMKNYAKGAYIATQLAAFIANLGYEAEAQASTTLGRVSWLTT